MIHISNEFCRESSHDIERFEYVFAGGLDIDPAMTPDLMEGACGLAHKLAETI